MTEGNRRGCGREGGRGCADPLGVRGPNKRQLLVPSLIHTHSCKHLRGVRSLWRHDYGHWILINSSAAESERSSANIWQPLFIDLTGGREESTATRSRPIPKPWSEEIASVGRSCQAPGPRAPTQPLLGKKSLFLFVLMLVGVESGKKLTAERDTCGC